MHGAISALAAAALIADSAGIMLGGIMGVGTPTCVMGLRG